MAATDVDQTMMSIAFEIRVVHTIQVNQAKSETPRGLRRVQSKAVRHTYGFRSQ